jgi:hypothetical protein
MQKFIVDSRDPIFYNEVFREYYIKHSNGTNIITFSYCPWCGIKLINSLRDNFFDIIFDELHLDGYDDPRLPSEFKTDEWWKKRGL